MGSYRGGEDCNLTCERAGLQEQEKNRGGIISPCWGNEIYRLVLNRSKGIDLGGGSPGSDPVMQFN